MSVTREERAARISTTQVTLSWVALSPSLVRCSLPFSPVSVLNKTTDDPLRLHLHSCFDTSSLSLDSLKLRNMAKVEVKFTQIFINNEWHNSVSGKTFPSINPATEEKLADVQEGDKVTGNFVSSIIISFKFTFYIKWTKLYFQRLYYSYIINNTV